MRLFNIASGIDECKGDFIEYVTPYGVPVIASRQDAGQEVNVHGVTGYNVNLDTQENLSEALITLLTEPDKAHAMGAAGWERWRWNFTYSGFKTRFLYLLADEKLLPVPRADRT